MPSLETRRRFRKFLYSYVTLAVLAAAVLLLAHAVWGMYQKEQATQEKITDRRERLAELEERKQWLSDEIGRLSSRRGIEEEVRKKFDVAKEGEEVLVIVDPEGQQRAQTASAQAEQGIFERILRFFGVQ